MRAARRSGHCGETARAPAGGDCVNGHQGSWPLLESTAADPGVAVATCLDKCRRCERCSFVSYSRKWDDCSWYAECPAAVLEPSADFVTEEVKQGATVPHQALPSPSQAGPIKIYIYDLATAWSSRNRIGAPISLQPYGPSMDVFGTTAASAPTYTSAVLALAVAWRTSRPEEADLFFLPSPSGVNPWHVSRHWCTHPLEMFGEHWKGTVNYFERHGGRDHFSVWHREHDLRLCPAWFVPPLRGVTKAVGVLSCSFDRGCAGSGLPSSRPEVVASAPSVLEVPYGGSVHNASFWTVPRARPLLAVAAFNAGIHLDYFRQMKLREVLRAQCNRAGLPRCQFVALGGKFTLWTDAKGQMLLGRTLRAMGRARFSLQPAGDDPARKSIIDSLTQGCIPVLFHAAQRALWPLHWGPWADESHVYIPHEAVLNGSVDVLAHLGEISAARVKAMQRAIARRAHRLVYGLSASARNAFGILTAEVLRRHRRHLGGGGERAAGRPVGGGKAGGKAAARRGVGVAVDARVEAILIANSIPSHPSTYVLRRAVTSIAQHVRLPPRTPLHIVHDGLAPSASPARTAAYAAYKDAAARWLRDEPPAGLRTTVRFLRGGQRNLTGTLHAALHRVAAPWLLVCQHDLPFVRDVDVTRVVADMTWSGHLLKHVRFGQWPVERRGDDAGPLFGRTIAAPHYTYTRTNGWSDQNHVASLAYYQRIIFPLLGQAASRGYARCQATHGKVASSRARFMEDCINPLVHADSEVAHGVVYGTYLFGAPGAPAVVDHLNARKYNFSGAGKPTRVAELAIGQEYLFKD